MSKDKKQTKNKPFEEYENLVPKLIGVTLTYSEAKIASPEEKEDKALFPHPKQARKALKIKAKEYGIEDIKQRHDLRTSFFDITAGLLLIVIMMAFILVQNYVVEAGSKVSIDLLKTWIAATVIEVISLMLIIARYLFPPKSSADQLTFVHKILNSLLKITYRRKRKQKEEKASGNK
jgi:hypothetical protein